LSQIPLLSCRLGALARQKVQNRDAIATARRIARQNRNFLFAILARRLPFR
jgi:hypothetical protein